MMIKKFTALTMSAIMILTLTSCAASDNSDASTASAEASQNTEASDAAGEGTGYGTKEETVYVTTTGDGSVQNILVSEQLKNPEGYATLKDITNLSDIVNVKGDEAFSISGDEITFEADGSDIYYQGSLDDDASLPVGLKITYILDGNEISADELKGKSGKLTMTIEYLANEKTDDGVYVPFLAVTGMLLSTDSFHNVAVTNGKVISNGDYSIVMGMGLPGAAESLSVEVDIPNTVEVTADVTDCDIDMLVTVVTNEVFSDISFDDNTEDLNSVSDMITLLGESSAKLTDGAAALNDGLLTLYNSTDDLAAGIEKLNDGAATISENLEALSDGAAALYDGINVTLLNGMTALDTGLGQLYNGAVQINSGVDELCSTVYGLIETLQGTIDQNNEEIEALKATISSCESMIAESGTQNAGLEAAIEECNAGILQYQGANAAISSILSELQKADDDGKTVNDKLNELKEGTAALENGIKSAKDGSSELTSGITDTLSPAAKQLADGSTQLSSGALSLADGLNELNSKIPELISGIKTLSDGANELSIGMSTFDESAIQKICDAYNNDFEAVISDLNKMLEAGKSYSTLTGAADGYEGTAAFIINTKF